MPDARRAHALWISPLIALAGLGSYFTLTVAVRELSDFPWLNLIVLALAVAGSAWALPQAWRTGGVLRRAAATLGLAFSGLCAGLLTLYCFSISYGLPAPEAALPPGEPLPALTLLDDRGQPHELEALARGDAVVVFFRGHW